MYQHGTTIPMGGGGGAGGGGIGVVSFPGLQYLLYVDKSVPATAGADGTQRRPYNTIGAALVKAVMLAPTANAQVGIYVYAGVYAESGLGVPAYVHLIGQSRDAVRIENVEGPLVVLTSGHTTVRQITFRTLRDEALASVDGTAAAFTKPAEFLQCAFEGLDLDTNAIVVTAHSLARFTGCQIRHPNAAALILDVTTTAHGVELYGCELDGFGDFDGGDVTIRSSYWVADDAYTVLLSGVANVDIRSNVLLNVSGDVLRIGSQPTGTTEIIDNYMEAAAGSDSVAVVAPGAIITLGLENNVMVGGGIEGGFAPLSEFRVLGASGDTDWYDTLTEAVASVDRDGVVIEMHKDEVLASQLVVPAYNFAIDGRNMHTITGALNGLLANNQYAETTLRRVALLGNIGIDGDGSRITLEDVYMVGTAHVASGDLNAWIVLVRSSIIGTDQGAAIDIHDNDPSVRLYWSYVKGAAGIYAIYWNNGAVNPYVDLVSSTAMHGTTGAGNSPFGRNAAQLITFSACQCAFEVDPATFAGFTNDIAAGQQLNTLDVNADWV